MWMTMRRLSISGILQASQLGTPYPRAIERHQYHAMRPSLGRVDEVGNFFWLKMLDRCRIFFGYGVSATLQAFLIVRV